MALEFLTALAGALVLVLADARPVESRDGDFTAPSERTEVRLRASAVTAGDTVLLGEIAEIRRDPLNLGPHLEALKLGPAGRGSVDRDRVVTRLREQGFRNAWIHLTGPERVGIRRGSPRSAGGQPASGESGPARERNVPERARIRPGQPVTLRLAGRFVRAEARGRALSGAREGETFRMRLEPTGTVVEARLRGPGRAVPAEEKP